MSRLYQIKLLHTIIWAIEASAIVYLLYTGILGVQSVLVLISFVLVIIEAIILLLYRWRCPLTVYAEKLTDDTTVGFDIFLPKWLAKYNKTIFTIIFACATILHIIHFLL